MSTRYIDEYLAEGLKLFRLKINSKLPVAKRWQLEETNRKVLMAHTGNFGWHIGKKHLVIDIDNKNGKDGTASFKKLCETLNVSFDKTVTTASGTHHIYLSLPESEWDSTFSKSMVGYKGLDFLSGDHYVVIPGSHIEDKEKNITGYYSWHEENLLGALEFQEAPKKLLDVLRQRELVEMDDGDFLAALASEDDAAEIIEALDGVRVEDLEYTHWAKIGMALHRAYEIGESTTVEKALSNTGFKIWNEWSKRDKREGYYEGPEALFEKWESFGKKRSAVGLGTLYDICKLYSFNNDVTLAQEYVAKIKAADLNELTIHVARDIRKANIPTELRGSLVKAYQERVKALSGPLPIAEARKALGFDKVAASGNVEYLDEVPEWCSNWVMVESTSQYVDSGSRRSVTAAVFNNKCGKYVPLNDQGSKPTATKYVADHGFIETVETMMYLPYNNDFLCVEDGISCVNTYNHSRRPVPAADFTVDGKKAIKVVKEHISMIVNFDEKNAEILLYWLAHQVQFPGRKVLWSPIIQSIQGIGKSFFGRLLMCCLGSANVGVVAPREVRSQFNGWATGTAVVVLEELYVAAARHEVVNALKPLITDRMIQINDKGIPQFNTLNTSNYICFTNFKDSIPVDENDRRWWIIYNDLEHLSDIKKFIGLSTDEYFARLFDAIDYYPEEMHKWLLTVQIPEWFMRLKQAPMTIYKEDMIANEQSRHGDTETLRDVIQTSMNPLISEAILSREEVFNELEIEGVIVGQNQKTYMLNKLGYSVLTPSDANGSNKRVKIDGKYHQFFYRGKRPSMTKSEIREYFEKRQTDSKDDNAPLDL